MRWITIGAGIAGVAALSFGLVHLYSTRLPSVTVEFSPAGIKSIKSGNVDFLENGGFSIQGVELRKPTGEVYFGPTLGSTDVRADRKEITKTLPWGVIKIGVATSGNRMTMTIVTTNTSNSETIQGLWYQPLTLRFPSKVKEYDGSTPLLAHDVGEVAATRVSFGTGTLAVVAEDLEKPLMVGFPWALDRPTNTVFPLSVHTDRVKMYPDSYPTIHRPIAPHQSEQFVISLRFGQANTSDEKLMGDVYRRYAQVFPSQLKWSDRRPIGAIFLAAGSPGWPTNPRGWFGDQRLNVMTAEGRSAFKQRVLNLADNSIAILHEMNAQGMITWDIEGQEFAHATTYIGDPRAVDTLAPEMADVADEYFARFRDAGLRTGICIRPQLLRLAPDKASATQVPAADPAGLLMDKIAYAKKRWGVAMFYIDTNVNPDDPNPMDPALIQKVAAAFPDCLLIPEHATLRYYAYSMPFRELRHGLLTTPDLVREIYPNASTLIYTADGPLDYYHASLKDAVKHGDTLIYRTWYRDPQNDKVRTLIAQ
jgi:hypothetical protein